MRKNIIEPSNQQKIHVNNVLSQYNFKAIFEIFDAITNKLTRENDRMFL